MKYPQEWHNLPKKERRKKLRLLKREQEKRHQLLKKLTSLSLALGLLGILSFGIYYFFTHQEILPPTDIAGHIEQNPPSHILDKPMPLTIQKHMLEHADGQGPPGVVINYNCEDFTCEPDLKEKLTEIVRKYPEFVFLAPFPKMSKKIAITRYGKIATFDDFNKEALINFIEGR